MDQVFTLLWINSGKIFADIGNLFLLEHKIQQETEKAGIISELKL